MSPHPFISSPVWLAWRVLHGAALGVGEPAFRGVEAVAVPEAVKAKSQMSHVLGSFTRPGDFDAQLEAALGPPLLSAGSWPVCCDTLCTIVSYEGRGWSLADIEGSYGSLAECAIDHAETWRLALADWRTDPRSVRKGICVFRCSRCGRPYVSFF